MIEQILPHNNHTIFHLENTH